MQFFEQYTYLEDDLQQTDRMLFDILSTADEPIKTLSIQLLHAGGKRVRPLLCLLSSYFGSHDQNRPYQLALILELIHMSSLIHDDVIDHAPLRRGITTIHETHDNQTAVFAGNYLFAQTLELLTQIRESRVHKIISNTLTKLSIGELEQLDSRFKIDCSLKNYLRRNRNKTARLIAISCQLGALVTGAPKWIQQTLYWVGYDLGMSYQIIDDILDFTDQEQKFGKLKGQDLLAGYLTLPSLIALKDQDIAGDIKVYFNQRQQGKRTDVKPIIIQINQTDAVEQAYQYSQWYLRRALKKIKQLPEQKEKQILFQVVGFLMKRKY